MEQKNIKYHANGKSYNSNVKPKVENKEAVDATAKLHSPKTNNPDREKIEKAAAARVKEETEKRKRIREKAERHKEETERAEQEKIEKMKMEAAEKSEALERKNAIKSAEAKLNAAAAAEKRAVKAEEMGLAVNSMQPVPEIPVREIKVRENACTSNEAEPSCAKDSPDLALHYSLKRYKEEEREKVENVAADIEAASETLEALDKREDIENPELRAEAAVTRARAAAAAEARLSLVSSQTEAQEKVTDSISNIHKLKAGTQTNSSNIINSYNMENTPCNLINPINTENQQREMDGLQAAKGTSKKRINLSAMHSHFNDKEAIHSTLENQQQKLGYSEEFGHANKSGVKPEEIIKGLLIQPAHNQAEQNNGQPIKSSNTVDIQPNSKTIDREEKEIVTVTGKTASQSRDSGGQKETVFMTGRENFIVNERDDSLIYKTDKTSMDYTELQHKKKIWNKEFEENKQECTQGYWNSHTSGNRGVKEPIHKGEHSYRSQQHTTSPTQSYERLQYSHHQPYPKEQRNHIHNNDRMKERDHKYVHSINHPRIGAQQMSQFSGSSRGLVCGSCSEMFNLHKRLPRNLSCGHSICSHCTSVQAVNSGFVSCPICPAKTLDVKSLKQLSVNQPLVELLSEVMQDDATKENQERRGLHVHEGSDRGKYYSQLWNNIARSGMRQAGNKFIPQRSPHGSKCMEIGVRPSVFCITCKVWLCSKCAETEHSNRRCSVIAMKDQLAAMRQKNLQEGSRAQELLSKSLQDLEKCLNEDKIFLILMKTALECVEKKQECIKKELREGIKLKESLTNAIKSVPCATNLPEALTVFQEIEDMASAAQQWVSSSEFRATGDDQEKTACLKHLMRMTLQSLVIENGASDTFAIDKVFGAELHSELRVDGGRFHLHALRRSHPTSQGSRTLPVECFKSCQDAESTLVFLDLSWGGMDHGRLYIRLTGDTLRGRQFISLCIGEGGISFRGTCFHRVWWKGLPGEHVWTGDLEKHDGSGGRSLFSPSSHEKVPVGRKVPISAGLVAGRYEKEISSVFRIYTRMEKEGRDEAGFGQVEFGLDIVREALKLRNITDVMISDCGLVLEM